MLLHALLWWLAAASPPADAGREVAVSLAGQAFVAPGAPADRPENALPYRVVVERGLEAEGPEFVAAVERTLGDPAGWGGAGRPLVRVAGRPRFTVVLATPSTVDRLCAPLRTTRQLSCGRDGRAVINAARWREGARSFGANLEEYRRYLINHEVGHLLGMPHAACPAPGERAPVMLPQTRRLDGCVPHGWPSPAEIARLRARSQ